MLSKIHRMTGSPRGCQLTSIGQRFRLHPAFLFLEIFTVLD
jgi:hypothetical protein